MRDRGCGRKKIVLAGILTYLWEHAGDYKRDTVSFFVFFFLGVTRGHHKRETNMTEK